MENEFYKIMLLKSDVELLEIVTILRNDYQPKAVLCAEDEIRKRNLTIELISEAKANSDVERDSSRIINSENKQVLGPLNSTPYLTTVGGVGGKIYGDTLYFVIAFIPLYPIARYSLDYRGDGWYSFNEKLVLHSWQKYWQNIIKVVGFVLVLKFLYYLFRN